MVGSLTACCMCKYSLFIACVMHPRFSEGATCSACVDGMKYGEETRPTGKTRAVYNSIISPPLSGFLGIGMGE